MRLLLDLQCVQSSSAVRGIGRYALCLSRALAETAGDHSVAVLLNSGDDPDRLLRARTALESFLPARDIHVFDAAWPFAPGRTPARRRAAEAARTAAIRSLRPDAVLVGSVFEGDVENVFSVDDDPASPPTAALLFDLIPAADPGTYLLGPGADDYWRRFADLQRADLLLSISDYSARQAHRLVPRCPPTTTVWGGPYPSGAFPAFEQRGSGADASPAVPGSYLLAVGGDHPRKNLDRLVQAWTRVPPATRRRAPLVLACRLNVGTVRRLRRLARRGGLVDGDLVLTGEVSEDALAGLYDHALGFVFPSTEEGLGMPPLEAMARRCPTVLARSSSLVELADDPDAFFDPTDVDDIARALVRLVDDPDHRDRLRRTAAASAARFTWTRSAELSWEALEQLVRDRGKTTARVDAPTVPVVAADDSAALRTLSSSPAAVALGPTSDRHVLEDPAALGLDAEAVVEDATRLGLPPASAAVRAALAPALALVADDVATAAWLVAAGVLDQPIVPPHGLRAVTEHDPVAPLAATLDTGALTQDLVADVVAAAARPPRWTLERPAPVVLVLTADGEQPWTLPADVHVASGGTGAAVLALLADHVVVPRALLEQAVDDLHRARRAGTGVHVVVDAEDDAVPAWASALRPEALADAAFDRRTGWPWRDGG